MIKFGRVDAPGSGDEGLGFGVLGLGCRVLG